MKWTVEQKSTAEVAAALFGVVLVDLVVGVVLVAIVEVEVAASSSGNSSK